MNMVLLGRERRAIGGFSFRGFKTCLCDNGVAGAEDKSDGSRRRGHNCRGQSLLVTGEGSGAFPRGHRPHQGAVDVCEGEGVGNRYTH